MVELTELELESIIVFSSRVSHWNGLHDRRIQRFSSTWLDTVVLFSYSLPDTFISHDAQFSQEEVV